MSDRWLTQQQEYGVSRTVVLAPKNYETFRLGDEGEGPALGVIHILELRCGIESEMAALAAKRHTAAEMRQFATWPIRQIGPRLPSTAISDSQNKSHMTFSSYNQVI